MSAPLLAPLAPVIDPELNGTEASAAAIAVVNKHVFMDAADLNNSFETAKPFRHVVIDDFLVPAVADQMLEEFPSEAHPERLVNEFGAPNPKSQISDIKKIGGVYKRIDEYIQSDEFLRLMSEITGIPDLIYDPWYFGAGTHENFHTAGLDPHYDFNIHPNTGFHRRINAILYLNREWAENWGGAITFHSNAWDLKDGRVKSVQPIFNRCVIFETTENSWHSVPPVDLPEDQRHQSRKSFTIYMYTKTRPAEELAPEHGTIYVQTGLPAHIRAGRTLTDSDMASIEANLQRRQSYLRAMYSREYSFAQEIDSLKKYITELERHPMVPLLGYGIVKLVSNPLNMDRWMGEVFQFCVEARREVKGVRLIGWCADGLDRSIAVRLHADDIEQTVEVRSGLFSVEVAKSILSGQSLEIGVHSNYVRRASDEDQRMISIIVDAVELLH